MVEPFERLSSEVVLETAIFTVREDRARHPRSGREGRYLVLDQPDWVNVIALTPDDRIVMIRQWRHGTRAVELEVPAGIVDPGEQPLEAAIRELREETGYAPGAIEVVGAVAPNPAYQANTCHTFVATGCTRVADQDLDPGEDIEVELLTRDELDAAIASGELRNAQVICALFWWERGSDEPGAGDEPG